MAASAAWGKDAWWHPGGLAWSRPSCIAFVDGSWAWIDGESAAVLGEVSTATVQWAAETGARLLIDHRRLPLPRVEGAPYFLDVRREPDLTVQMPPPGVRLGVVEDVSSFVECHRQSWRPHDLPFAAPKTFPADASSSFNELRWVAITSDPMFDPSLVVVGYQGEAAVGSCIAWFDPQNSSAEIEPLGVVPAARGRGVARALVLESLNRLAHRGAREVVVRPRGDDDYPAPRALYASCGFTTRQRNVLYRLDA